MLRINGGNGLNCITLCTSLSIFRAGSIPGAHKSRATAALYTETIMGVYLPFVIGRLIYVPLRDPDSILYG